MAFLFLVLCFIFVQQCSALRFGSCPEVETMQDFNMERYYGMWWEIERYPNVFQTYTRCVTDTYNRRPDGNIEVLYKRIGTWTGMNRTTSGYLEVPDQTQPAKMRAHLSQWIPSGNYWILDTDYDSYSIVYTCADYGYFHMDFAWIMTREMGVIRTDVKSHIYNLMERNNIDTSRFISSDLQGC